MDCKLTATLTGHLTSSCFGRVDDTYLGLVTSDSEGDEGTMSLSTPSAKAGKITKKKHKKKKSERESKKSRHHHRSSGLKVLFILA